MGCGHILTVSQLTAGDKRRGGHSAGQRARVWALSGGAGHGTGAPGIRRQHWLWRTEGDWDTGSKSEEPKVWRQAAALLALPYPMTVVLLGSTQSNK